MLSAWMLALVPSATADVASTTSAVTHASDEVTRKPTSPVAKAQRVARSFLVRVNKRHYRAAARLTLDRRDLRVAKSFRKRGYRFGRVVSCDIAPPEGFQCSATVKRRGKPQGSVWMRADGTDLQPWKVWEVVVVLGE